MNRKILIYTKAFSDLGTMMELVVINGFILALTHNPNWLAATLGARVLGGLLSSLYAGVIADRYSRRKIMIQSDILRAIVIVALVLYPEPYMFIITVFLLGVFGSFFAVSFSSEVPQIFGEDKVLEVNALLARLGSISMVIGFLGAALLSSVDIRIALSLDALSFLLSAVVLFTMNWEQDSSARVSTSDRPIMKFIKDVTEVRQYLLLKPLILMLFLVFLVQTFGASSHNLGIPILAEILDEEKIMFYQGLIWGAWGIGSVLATFIVSKLKKLMKLLIPLYLYSSIFMSIGFILLLSSTNFQLIITFAFLTGIFDATCSTLYSTIMQQTDNRVRGRVFGVSALINRLGFFIGFVIAPLILQQVGMPKMVMTLHGIIIFAVILGISFTYIYGKRQAKQPIIEEGI